MKKNKLLLVCIFCISTTFLTAQSISNEVIASSGDYYENDVATLSWTLGEPVIETFSSDEVILTQGFQQSYYQVVAVKDLNTDSYNVRLFPVPAVDYVNLEVTTPEEDISLIVEMFDATGTLVYEQQIQTPVFLEKINLNKYQSGMFFLKVQNTLNKQVKSFKIIKLK